MQCLRYGYVAGLFSLAASASAFAATAPVAPGVSASGAKLNSNLSAGIREFPFIVSIASHDQACTGTVMSEYWVLSAASCVGNDASGMTVYVTDDIQFSGVPYRVQAVHRLPIGPVSSTFGEVAYDVALLRLNAPLEFSERLAPLVFSTQDTDSAAGLTPFLLFGWQALPRPTAARITQGTTLRWMDAHARLGSEKNMLSLSYPDLPAHINAIQPGDSGSPWLVYTRDGGYRQIGLSAKLVTNGTPYSTYLSPRITGEQAGQGHISKWIRETTGLVEPNIEGPDVVPFAGPAGAFFNVYVRNTRFQAIRAVKVTLVDRTDREILELSSKWGSNNVYSNKASGRVTDQAALSDYIARHYPDPATREGAKIVFKISYGGSYYTTAVKPVRLQVLGSKALAAQQSVQESAAALANPFGKVTTD